MANGSQRLFSTFMSDTDSCCYLVLTRCLSRWKRSVSVSLMFGPGEHYKQGRRQVPRSGAAEAIFKGDLGSSPRNFWNLDGKSCTLGKSLYKIIHRNFFSPVLDVPRGPTLSHRTGKCLRMAYGVAPEARGV